MFDYSNNLIIKLDGTIKQINPISKTEVWTVPGRKNRPLSSIPKVRKKIESENIHTCPFCKENYFKTPPENLRMIKNDNRFEFQSKLNYAEVMNTEAEFRLIPNLFEIITYNYWAKNYGYKLTGFCKEAMEKYISTSDGLNHILNIIDMKLKYSGFSEEEIMTMGKRQKISSSEAFFGGTHKVIVAKKHFIDGAEYDDELFSCGSFTPEEHYQYFRFTVQSLKMIYDSNPYVRYVSVYQNWLPPAGASIEHLHMQLVGIDEWGTSIQRELELLKDNFNIYNDAVINFSIYNNLVFLENQYAVALADIGHRYPTIAIYSKSSNTRPYEHNNEEIKDISNLVQAIHLAIGRNTPCNEEWYYSPRDTFYVMPWHILIKLRTNNPAGFEGGTKIYINPVSPFNLRDELVRKLYDLRSKKLIDSNIKIAEECNLKPNLLRYVQKFNALWSV